MLSILPAKPLLGSGVWHEVDLELIDAPVQFEKGLKASASVMVPLPEAEYGIISDIDDTIIRTEATNLLAMSANVFLHNARTRLPFPGVSQFYKALQQGRKGNSDNPFFYVSSSPWNLYDLLVDFMDHNEIPQGTLLLRDLGWKENKFFNSGHLGHKFTEIKKILNTYPDMNFVLIGDSGQEDPSIYSEVVKKYPGRILAIYIRDVQLKNREKIAIDISKGMIGHHVEMVIVDTTVEASAHALKIGLIHEDVIPQVEIDKKLDYGEIPGKEELTT